MQLKQPATLLQCSQLGPERFMSFAQIFEVMGNGSHQDYRAEH
jgi:hypothetical protein